MSNMEKFAVHATAKQVHRRHVLLRTAGVVALISTVLLLISFALANFVNKAGNFTVNVLEQGPDKAITISNNKDFSNPTTSLEADIIDQMDNTTESWLPENVDDVDGSHNGDNYIAYTFYVKNSGKETVSYQADIDILSVLKNADEAVRIKVYHNGEATLFAKRQKDKTDPEPDTTPFFSETKVMSQTFDNMKPGDQDKFTVVIWLEGNDPECVDNILGGEVKMAMRLKIINQNGELV